MSHRDISLVYRILKFKKTNKIFNPVLNRFKIKMNVYLFFKKAVGKQFVKTSRESTIFVFLLGLKILSFFFLSF